MFGGRACQSSPSRAPRSATCSCLVTSTRADRPAQRRGLGIRIGRHLRRPSRRYLVAGHRDRFTRSSHLSAKEFLGLTHLSIPLVQLLGGQKVHQFLAKLLGKRRIQASESNRILLIRVHVTSVARDSTYVCLSSRCRPAQFETSRIVKFRRKNPDRMRASFPCLSSRYVRRNIACA